jgi:hypothetical protein
VIRRRRAQEIIKIIKAILWTSINGPRRSKEPEETLLYWRKTVGQIRNHPEAKK